MNKLDKIKKILEVILRILTALLAGFGGATLQSCVSL